MDVKKFTHQTMGPRIDYKSSIIWTSRREIDDSSDTAHNPSERTLNHMFPGTLPRDILAVWESDIQTVEANEQLFSALDFGKGFNYPCPHACIPHGFFMGE